MSNKIIEIGSFSKDKENDSTSTMDSNYKLFKEGNTVAFVEEGESIAFSILLIANKECFSVIYKEQLFMCSFEMSDKKKVIPLWEFRI